MLEKGFCNIIIMSIKIDLITYLDVDDRIDMET